MADFAFNISQTIIPRPRFDTFSHNLLPVVTISQTLSSDSCGRLSNDKLSSKQFQRHPHKLFLEEFDHRFRRGGLRERRQRREHWEASRGPGCQRLHR
jgi:hypothetical protein